MLIVLDIKLTWYDTQLYYIVHTVFSIVLHLIDFLHPFYEPPMKYAINLVYGKSRENVEQIRAFVCTAASLGYYSRLGLFFGWFLKPKAVVIGLSEAQDMK